MKGKDVLRAARQADAEREQQRKSALLQSPVTEDYQLSSASIYYYTPPPLENNMIERGSQQIFKFAYVNRLSKEDDEEQMKACIPNFSVVRNLIPSGLKRLRYSKMWKMTDIANGKAVPYQAYDLMEYIQDNGKSFDLKLSKDEIYDLFAIGCLVEIGSNICAELTYEIIHRIITGFGYSNAAEVLAEEILKDVPGDQ